MYPSCTRGRCTRRARRGARGSSKRAPSDPVAIERSEAGDRRLLHAREIQATHRVAAARIDRVVEHADDRRRDAGDDLTHLRLEVDALELVAAADPQDGGRAE